MMESKDYVSTVIFRLKNGNVNLVSFHAQGFTFDLSINGI